MIMHLGKNLNWLNIHIKWILQHNMYMYMYAIIYLLLHCYILQQITITTDEILSYVTWYHSYVCTQ
jgi:hypothetical protein